MYKVFFNDNFLIIAGPEFQPYEDISVHKLQSFNQIEKWLLEAEKSNNPHHLILSCSDPANILEQITEKYKYVEAAGGLVKNKHGKYLFIFRRGKWDLPKGKIDQNESSEHAAIREVIEETGLKNIFITEKLIDTYHFYRTKGKLILKKTFWYEMKNMGSEKLTPQYDEDIELAKWIKPDQIYKLMGNMFSSVSDVIKTDKNIGKILKEQLENFEIGKFEKS